MGAAQEHEARGFVFWIITASLGLIDFARQQPAGAGRAPTLQTHVRQIQAGINPGVKHIFVVGDRNLDFPTLSDKSDLMNSHEPLSKIPNPKNQIPRTNSKTKISF